LQVVYFRPGDILKNNMSKHVPVADCVSFQSSANEMMLLLLKMASQKAGYHIDNMTQAGLTSSIPRNLTL